jgi:hypothetical protein
MIQLAGDERVVEGSHFRHRDGCLSPTASETAARDESYIFFEVAHQGPVHALERKRPLRLQDGDTHCRERQAAGAVIRSVHRVDNETPAGRGFSEAPEARFLREHQPSREAGTQLFEHRFISGQVERPLRVTTRVDAHGRCGSRRQTREPAANRAMDAHQRLLDVTGGRQILGARHR